MPYILVMHTVVETQPYVRTATAAGMDEKARETVVDVLSRDPIAGDVMPGTGGCRKVRVAAPGRGKSGGYRIIYVFGGEDLPVFLLAAYSKSAKGNLSKAERNSLATLVDVLKQTYSKRR